MLGAIVAITAAYVSAVDEIASDACGRSDRLRVGAATRCGPSAEYLAHGAKYYERRSLATSGALMPTRRNRQIGPARPLRTIRLW
jgi:hypothetical protein